MTEKSQVEGPRRRHHVRRWVLLGLAAVLVVGTVLFAVAWRQSGSRPVSLNEARKRLGTTVTAGNAAPLQPAAGIYEYRGSGTESLDKPPKSQDQGPVIPGTVTYDAAGCWTIRADYSTGHWQNWKFCAQPGGGLAEAGGQTHSEWDFVLFKVNTTSTLVCSQGDLIRPGMKPGDSYPHVCSGTSTGVSGETKIDGTTTYVGPETITVGGVAVPVYHFRHEGRLGGAQSGTQSDDEWLSRATGLPIRNDRRNDVASDSPIGKVTYTERGTFTLTSLTPRS